MSDSDPKQATVERSATILPPPNAKALPIRAVLVTAKWLGKAANDNAEGEE